MLIDIEILIVEVELIGGARGCGQTGFALRFMCIFLSGICAAFSAKRIESFCGAFFKKRLAEGTRPRRRRIELRTLGALNCNV